MADILGWFIAGVVVVAVAYGGTYLGQFFYARNHNKTGHVINGITWLLVIASYLLFALGCYSGYLAIKSIA